MELEYRTVEAELRAATGNGQQRLIGYAAVFNSLSEDLGGFRERIAAGAFRNTLKADVRALVNHDPNLVLGRSTSGTLRLAEDERGLLVEMDLPPTQAARDLWVVVQRGDMSQMSFRFWIPNVEGERWERVNGETIRTLLDVRIDDVSVVTYPAYQKTVVAVQQRAADFATGLNSQSQRALASNARKRAIAILEAGG